MASRSALFAQTEVRSQERQDLPRRAINHLQASGTSEDRPASRLVAVRAGPLIPASLRHDMVRGAAYVRAEARGL
jgi:hypothetical protein